MEALQYVHDASGRLCKQVMGESLSVLGNIVIFCHYEDEYERLKQIQAGLITDETIDGRYFKLKTPIVFDESNGVTGATYNYLYIRQPDPWRSQVGDLDFYLAPDKYRHLKSRLQKGEKIPGARIFPRDDLDMIELFDPDVDVLVYVRPVTLDA